jgi:hypothetical protein
LKTGLSDLPEPSLVEQSTLVAAGAVLNLIFALQGLQSSSVVDSRHLLFDLDRASLPGSARAQRTLSQLGQLYRTLTLSVIVLNVNMKSAVIILPLLVLLAFGSAHSARRALVFEQAHEHGNKAIQTQTTHSLPHATPLSGDAASKLKVLEGGFFATVVGSCPCWPFCCGKFKSTLARAVTLRLTCKWAL